MVAPRGKAPGRTVEIFGVKVHDVSYQEALDYLEHCIATRSPTMVCTPNTEIVMRARRDPAYAEILNNAGLAIPDGIGLMLAARLFGDRIREHVRGTDLVEKLAVLASWKGYRLYLLGAAEGVADRAAAKLTQLHPGLQIAGTHAGSPDPQYDRTVADMLRDAGTIDLLLVAYGAPAQEYWIARNQARLGVPVAIGVGGVLDFLSGETRRAPAWVRRIELEWLYRLIQQPSRWRRQLALPHFAMCVLASWTRSRLATSARGLLDRDK